MFLCAALIMMQCATLISSQAQWMVDDLAVVQKAVTGSFQQEQMLFEKWVQSFFNVDTQDSWIAQYVQQLFQAEETLFLQKSNKRLFFNAFHADQMIGYISCDIVDNDQAFIRQLFFDPEMFDVALIKELLFAVFSAAPKIKYVSISYPAACQDIVKLLAELGFVQFDEKKCPVVGLCASYELKVHPKCKICDVLYGDIWYENGDLDEYEGDGDLQD